MSISETCGLCVKWHPYAGFLFQIYAVDGQSGKESKPRIYNPTLKSDHGCCHVAPNTICIFVFIWRLKPCSSHAISDRWWKTTRDTSGVLCSPNTTQTSASTITPSLFSNSQEVMKCMNFQWTMHNVGKNLQQQCRDNLHWFTEDPIIQIDLSEMPSNTEDRNILWISANIFWNRTMQKQRLWKAQYPGTRGKQGKFLEVSSQQVQHKENLSSRTQKSKRLESYKVDDLLMFQAEQYWIVPIRQQKQLFLLLFVLMEM